METNKLINQAINHVRQPIASEQSVPPSAVMDRLWERMLENYGHKWEGSYGTTPAEGWRTALVGITPQMIKQGLEKMAAKPAYLDWPPSALAFRDLCLPTSEDLGLPSDDDAFNQAVGNASEKHPSVIHTLRNMGDEVYKLRRSESGKAEKIFKKHWDKTVEHVMAGGELPEVEKQVEDKPVKASAEVAENSLNDLKEMFG